MSASVRIRRGAFLSVPEYSMKLPATFWRYLTVCCLLLGSLPLPAAADQAKVDAVSPERAEARAAAASGNTAEAVQKYHEAIQKAPRDTGLRLEIGRYLLSAGLHPDAIGMYKSASASHREMRKRNSG